MADLAPTCDPSVLIEAQSEGFVRYRASDGRRWEVHGKCDRRAHCMVGAVVDGEEITTLVRALELAAAYTGLDCPVTPEFSGCCPFTFVELELV